MAELPLLRIHGVGTVFAYRDERPVGVEEFLRDVARLAAALPERRYALNLCTDRYRFTVGFAAALLRGQVSLLPPNLASGSIGELGRCYPDVYCLTDETPQYPSLETFFFPETLEGGLTVPGIPTIPEAQIAAILFTSGSSGRPLPHQKTWRSLVAGARAEAERFGLQELSGMTILGTVPPQHMFGLESTVLLPLQNDLALHAGRPFFPADVCAALVRVPRPRGLVTTPVHLRALLAETSDVPPIDFLLSATASLSPQLAARAEACFAAPLYEIYGCTEAGQVATRRTVETAEWRPHGGVALRQDERGTWVSGGHVETESLLADVIELRGRDGFLLHGRTADLVNLAGKRTSLAHLDYHLNSIEGVHDGAFVVPEEEGHAVSRLMAFVVAPGRSNETIMKALRQRIDAAFLPRPLYFVDALPRNATGKLPREAFHELVRRHARKTE
jgi:acyl-coenzyme A synthetase/AMP-(fatty) acid ligase